MLKNHAVKPFWKNVDQDRKTVTESQRQKENARITETERQVLTEREEKTDM